MSGPIICTTSPSEDHTYSATSTPATDDDSFDVSSSSIDDEYDFGPEADDEDDEEEEEEEEEDYTDFDSYHSDFEEGSVSEEEEENSTPTRPAAATATTPTTHTPTNTNSAATPTTTTVTTLSSTGPQQRSPRCSSGENKDRLSSRQYRSKKHLLAIDEDEKKKIAESADALLNLAGIKTSEMVATVAVTMPAPAPAASVVVPASARGSLFSDSQTNAECWTGLSPESTAEQTVSWPLE